MKIKRMLRSYTLRNLFASFNEQAAGADSIYSWPPIYSRAESPLQTLAPGVTYQTITYQTSNGPIRIYETWVNLTEPGVGVRTVMSHDRLESERNETLLEMGKRKGALAGINGDFFESGASGMAVNMTIDQGKLLHHPTRAAVFGVDSTNRVTLGKFGFSGLVTAAKGQTYPLDVLNGHPVSYPHALILLTPELGHWEMASDATVLTLLSVGGNKYQVGAIERRKNVVEAPYQGAVKLLAQGRSVSFVDRYIQVGDVIEVAYGTVPSSNHLQYAIGGGPIWIKDGQAFSDPNPPAPVSSTRRDPQTGVAVTADGNHLLMVVVDGRSNGSIGLTQAQMANYLAVRGATDAMLFDGGGSTEMVVRLPGQEIGIVNRPSDGAERRIANGLFVFYQQQPKSLYRDTATHWAKSYIEELAAKNIVFPVYGDVFAPDQAVTRAEVLTFIVRALKLPLVPTQQFSDVPLDVGYNGVVGAAVKYGIARGVGDGKFAPADPVDRSQAAVMFCQALWAIRKPPKRGGTPLVFKDEAQIPSWAKVYVAALSSNGVMTGDGAGNFRPAAKVTRAEATVLTYKIMKYAGLL